MATGILCPIGLHGILDNMHIHLKHPNYLNWMFTKNKHTVHDYGNPEKPAKEFTTGFCQPLLNYINRSEFMLRRFAIDHVKAFI